MTTYVLERVATRWEGPRKEADDRELVVSQPKTAQYQNKDATDELAMHTTAQRGAPHASICAIYDLRMISEMVLDLEA
jgi:hypothetical protein